MRGPDASSPDQRAHSLPLPQLLCQTLSPYRNSLKVAHVNAQSLFCHIDEFRSIFQSPQFDIILISETWLKTHISDKSVDLFGYNIFRNDRTGKGGGGVAAYVKSHLPTIVIHSSDNSRLGRPEYMFLDTSINGTHVLVAVCYRAPNLGFMVEFEHALVELMASYRHVIVMGDFNSDLLGPDTHDKTFLTSMFHSCHLTILPLLATHHTATADTWLDVMAVADSDHVVYHDQHPAPGLSKHDLIFCAYGMLTPKSNAKFISFRNYKDINQNDLLQDAYMIPWNEVVLADDVDMMVNKFNFLVSSLYDRHAPLTKKRVTKQPAPWITDFIRQLQKQRDNAFRRAKRTKTPADWIQYKRLRNRAKQQMRNAKIRYYYQVFSVKQSTKCLWSKVKDLGIGGKSSSDQPVTIDLNIINNYFVDIPIDMRGAQDYVTKLDAATTNHPRHRFSFVPVTEADVRGAIMRVKSNAVGADAIPIKLLKDILPVVLPVITIIFNKSLSSSKFPSHWKLALVRPLPKVSSPVNPSDFRPISILSALSKCLERVVYLQISAFLETNRVLSNFQSGFRSKHSTTSALLKVTDDVRWAMDKKLVTILTLFDYSKAFDCVYYPLLLHKLSKIGFSNSCTDWVKSYLSDRKQSVKTYDKESEWKCVTRGVPQGSVLGPLLFSIYIDDVTTVIRYSKYHLYADDLQIYSSFSVADFPNSVANINLDIVAISSWAHKHGLKLNENKTQTIVIGNSRLLRNADVANGPRLELNNQQLQYSEKVKNLGLIIDKNLNWTDYANATCNRVFAGIHSLKRFAVYLPLNMRVMLVKTLVLPHFNYCNVVVNDMTVELAERLQRAQNYCIRFIFNLRRRDHVTPFFNELSLLKLDELRHYHILTLLHTVLITKTPSYLSDRFTFISEMSTRSMPTRRGVSLLSIPAHRTSVYNKSFTVCACRLWNNLPDHIRSIEECVRFRAEVKELLVRASRE